MKSTVIARLKAQVENPSDDGAPFGDLIDVNGLELTNIRTEVAGKTVSAFIPKRTKYLDVQAPLLLRFRRSSWGLVLIGIDTKAWEEA